MPPHPPFEVEPADGEIVYRLIDSPDPELGHFLSDEADGRTSNLYRSQNVAIYRGFSARETLEQAMKLARGIGKPYIAEVELDVKDGDARARTFGPGHFTVWAQSEKITQRVLRVHRVEG